MENTTPLTHTIKGLNNIGVFTIVEDPTLQINDDDTQNEIDVRTPKFVPQKKLPKPNTFKFPVPPTTTPTSTCTAPDINVTKLPKTQYPQNKEYQPLIDVIYAQSTMWKTINPQKNELIITSEQEYLLIFNYRQAIEAQNMLMTKKYIDHINLNTQPQPPIISLPLPIPDIAPKIKKSIFKS